MENTDEKREDTVSTIEGLISILEDGKLGYTNAAEDIEDSQLKADFLVYARERSGFIVELQDEINRLGKSTDTSGGGVLGAIHRTWIDIKSLVTGGDKEAIIEACITGEKAAIEKYEEALKDKNFSPTSYDLINNQKISIKNTLAKIELKKSL